MRGEQIDREALERLVESQIAGGIDAVIPVGTTGESATLSHEEHAEVIRLVVRLVKKRIPVIAGAGSNATSEAIALSKAAQEAGADALLHVTPYYNRPTQEGHYRHFRAIAESTGLPIILYNVPARTGTDLGVDTVARLAELPQIVGIKEASGTVQRTSQILAKLGDRLVVLSGEDAINYPLYAVGARGCISVVSNVAPKIVSENWDAHVAGDAARARKLHLATVELADALFMEPNPTPAKAALAMMGMMQPDLRLPLLPLTAANSDKLRAVLARHGLVK
jgi:4-hydroxy-tetrahydrodipicolinate synthase